jgi:septal ring factor EnvC (AmiA/AmiB activator)
MMAEEKKPLTVIFIPGNASKTYTFRLRRSLIFLLGVLCLFFFGSYVYVVSGHRRVASKARRAERLEMENEILRAQSQKVADLEGELARLQNIRQRLYEMAGLTVDLNKSQGAEVLSSFGATMAADEVYQQESMVSAADLVTSAWADTVQAGSSINPILWPVRGWVTAEFDELLPGREKKHTGMDIAAPLGTPILTAASGEVTFAGWDTDLGLVVVLEHQNGLSTLYGHCSRVLVDVGDAVTQGQAIAELGNTGKSSAPHLHFEIRENNLAIDPRKYLGP